MASSTPDYNVIRADLVRDRNVILEVWARNLSSTYKLEEKFDWHFVRNPNGPGRCWLLLANGEPAGTSCLGMRRVQASGATVYAGVACDLAVDKAHRFLQPALMLQKSVVSAVCDGVDFVYGLPNPRGAAPIKRVGYRESSELHRYARPIRISPYLARRAPYLPAAVGALADSAVRAFSRLRYRGMRGYRAEVVQSFDSRFDDLWERERGKYGVIGIRDARYLNWRYSECPLQSYEALALAAPGGRLAGYVVYYVDGGRMCWVDFLAGDDPDEAAGLIGAAIRQAQAAGAGSISVHGSAPAGLVSHLERLGFGRRTASPAANARAGDAETARTLLVYAAPQWSARALDPWYVTAGDEPYN